MPSALFWLIARTEVPRLQLREGDTLCIMSADSLFPITIIPTRRPGFSELLEELRAGRLVNRLGKQHHLDSIREQLEDSCGLDLDPAYIEDSLREFPPEQLDTVEASDAALEAYLLRGPTLEQELGLDGNA